jgi:hypothetical protein
MLARSFEALILKSWPFAVPGLFASPDFSSRGMNSFPFIT